MVHLGQDGCILPPDTQGDVSNDLFARFAAWLPSCHDVGPLGVDILWSEPPILGQHPELRNAGTHIVLVVYDDLVGTGDDVEIDLLIGTQPGD
jgi:hypothetical protein